MIDIDIILLELDNCLPDYDEQISIQGVEGIDDPFYGTGRIGKLNHTENEFVKPNFDMPYTNKVLKDLGMYRSRLMNMPPKTCYTYHMDYTKRIHIPLITNDYCFFVLEDEVLRIPADGNHYLIDTTKRHTFVNASLHHRLHLIGCVDS